MFVNSSGMHQSQALGALGWPEVRRACLLSPGLSVFSGGRALEGFVFHIRLLFPVSSPDKLNMLEGDSFHTLLAKLLTRIHTVQECIFHLFSSDLEVKE